MATRDGSEGIDELGFDPLFGIDDPIEPLSAFIGGLRRQPYDLQMLPTPRRSNALSVSLDDLVLQSSRDDASGTFYLDMVLTTHLPARVRLNKVQAVFRDGEGDLLDQDTYWASQQEIAPHGRGLRRENVLDFDFDGEAPSLHMRFGVQAGSVEAARTVTLLADYDFDFRQTLATGVCAPPPWSGRAPHREPWALALQTLAPAPGAPHFDHEVVGFSGFRYEPQLELLVQLTERTHTRDHARELIVTLRDAGAARLASERSALTLHFDSPALAHVRLMLAEETLRAVRLVDLAIEGTCSRSEALGTFQINRLTPR